MAIPPVKDLMKPILEMSKDGKEYSQKEAVSYCANAFKLTADERAERTRTGGKTFYTRVSAAKYYLGKDGYVETTGWGKFKITKKGVQLLNKGSAKDVIAGDEEKTVSPEEKFEESYQKIETQLASDLLETLKTIKPKSFEEIVVELIMKMGYGWSKKAGRVTQETRDGGIDGIIEEDRLGLDLIYLQAKRWKTSVMPAEIRSFSGALDNSGVKKGVLITTSTFTKQAIKEIEGSKSNSQVILIDGEELASLMIEHGVGVSVEATYEVKKVNFDDFEEL